MCKNYGPAILWGKNHPNTDQNSNNLKDKESTEFLKCAQETFIDHIITSLEEQDIVGSNAGE